MSSFYDGAVRRRDLRIVGRKRRGGIVRLDLKERAVPGEMHGKSGALDPRLLGFVEKREAFAGAPSISSVDPSRKVVSFRGLPIKN